eukprot:2287265-Pleurochrysis_carterae.AAC.3
MHVRTCARLCKLRVKASANLRWRWTLASTEVGGTQMWRRVWRLFMCEHALLSRPSEVRSSSTDAGAPSGRRESDSSFSTETTGPVGPLQAPYERREKMTQAKCASAEETEAQSHLPKSIHSTTGDVNRCTIGLSVQAL